MDLEVEKIVFGIFTIIKNDPELETFDIILEPNQTNNSPLLYEQHNLGLQSWCIKKVYCYVHQKLFEKQTSGIENHIALLTTASMLNPNVKTYWNVRKELVLQGYLDLYSELHYIEVILSSKPKVQDLFNHRKWLLKEIFKKQILRSDLFYNELKIVQKAANNHVNNHMAWDFACWLLNFIELNSEPVNILKTYWNITETWISTHVSDFSGMNFRQHLIKKFLDCTISMDINFKRVVAFSCFKNLRHVFNVTDIPFDDKHIRLFFIIGLILNDFEINENLILFYANHEALWYNRRFLCYAMLQILPEKLSKDEDIDVFFNIIKECENTESKLDIEHPFYVLFLRIHELFLSHASRNNEELFLKRYKNWLKLKFLDYTANKYFN